MRTAVSLSIVFLFAGGCAIERVDPCAGLAGGCLALHVAGSGAITHVDGLRVRVLGGALDHEELSTPNGHGAATLPVALALRFPSLADKSPVALTIEVTGRLAGHDVAGGSARALMHPGAHASVDVVLGGAPFPVAGDLGPGSDGHDGGCVATIASAATVASITPAQATMHLSTATMPRTTLVTVTLADLGACDRGTVTLSADAGSVGAADCTRSDTGATCTATYTAPITGDHDRISARSDDSGATGAATIALRPPITITLPSRADLLAFGAPAPPVGLDATLANVIDGEPATVSFSVDGASATITSTAGTHVVVAAAALPLPAASEPAPATLIAHADADPGATATTMLVVHAWVDQTPQLMAQLANAFDGNFTTGWPELWAVAETPAGVVLVGGKYYRPNVGESAWTATFDGKSWTSAGYTFTTATDTAGAITSAVVTPGGDFLVAGVAGHSETAQSDGVLALHCSGTPLSCGDLAGTHNLAPAQQFTIPPPLFGQIGIDDNGDGTHHGPFNVTVRPRIAVGTSGGKLHKYLSWSMFDPNSQCLTGLTSQAVPHLLADASGDLDTPFVLDAAHTIPLAPNLPASADGNSCPLNPYAFNNAITGWTVGAGGRLWMSGYADCADFQVSPAGTCTDDYCGCDPKATGMSGLAVAPLVDNVSPAGWSSLESPLAAVDLRCPVLGGGSDGTVLIANGCMNINGSAPFGWIAPGSTTPTLIVPPASGPTLGEYVSAIAGSPSGGTRWSGGQPDLFFALTRRTVSVTNPTSKSFYLGWYGGGSRVLVQTGVQDLGTNNNNWDGSGFELIDLSAVELASGEHELWAVGRFYDPGGFANGPMILRLR